MEITLVCVPYQMDVARWGYALGPQALLDAGLIQQLEERRHQVHGPVWIHLPASERTRDTVANLGRIASKTAAVVSATLQSEGNLVLALEGDCTHSVGVIGGVTQALGSSGVVWFDAHGDLNTMATSTSGYWGGMPYAVALGWDLEDWRLAAGLDPAVRPEAAALIGTSDLDQAEVEALRNHPILHLRAEELQPGAVERLHSALQRRAGVAPAWYLHLDLDVAGPEEVPGGMTPAPSWPPRQQLIEAACAAARAVPVRALAIATYNPAGDSTGRGARLGLDLALAIIESMGG